MGGAQARSMSESAWLQGGIVLMLLVLVLLVAHVSSALYSSRAIRECSRAPPLHRMLRLHHTVDFTAESHT